MVWKTAQRVDIHFKSFIIKSVIDWCGEKCPKFYENKPKWPVTVRVVVNSLKNQYKWSKLDPKK